MHALSLKTVSSVPVKYLRCRCGVRYWEDATVNGVVDTLGTLIPCRDAAPNDEHGGGNWCPTIDLDSGRIEAWPEGTTASVHYKVCDDGDYELLDADRKVVKAIDGYVPSLMCPDGEGYGDYIIMHIDGGGMIADWHADLSEFERAATD